VSVNLLCQARCCFMIARSHKSTQFEAVNESQLTRSLQCDGVRPKCSACEGLNLECSYVQLGSGSGSGSNVIVGKDYLKALEDRLKVVEETLTSGKIGQESLQRCSASCDGRSGEIENHPNGVSRALGPDQTGVEVNRDDLQDSSGLEDEADGMGAIQFSTEADCSFFGNDGKP